MNKESNNTSDNKKDKSQDPNIEWDNGEATYGHSISHNEFKKKNAPNDSHIVENEEKSNTINDLKNANLTNNEDIGNRNELEEKGLGGKDL